MGGGVVQISSERGSAKDTETNLELQIAICDVFFQMDSIWVII